MFLCLHIVHVLAIVSVHFDSVSVNLCIKFMKKVRKQSVNWFQGKGCDIFHTKMFWAQNWNGYALIGNMWQMC